MNKTDLKLIFITLSISMMFLIFLMIFQDKGSIAKVYYEDKLLLTIDLNVKEEKNYEVDGYNGKVSLTVSNGKIKVNEENSPLHLCSKQGYISKSYETIVCLPNKITIKIESNDDIDTIVK